MAGRSGTRPGVGPVNAPAPAPPPRHHTALAFIPVTVPFLMAPAPLVFANLFGLFISRHAPLGGHFPGVSFVLAAVLVVAALVLTARATREMSGAGPAHAGDAGGALQSGPREST